MRRLLPVLAVVPILLLAACSSSDSGTVSASPSASASTAASYITSQCIIPGGQPTPSESAPTRGTTVDGVTVEETDLAPVVTVAPNLPPATQLVKTTLAPGKGRALQSTDSATFNYCGVGLVTQTQFDSSWANGAPFTTTLDQVIQGWGQGLPGMKVGELRLLIIPSELGYGASGAGASILPNESLAFVVQLVSIGN